LIWNSGKVFGNSGRDTPLQYRCEFC
jgi:hypothetical protein